MPLSPASTLLTQLRSNLRRSLGQREVATHGLCLLLLVGLFVFAASSPISVVVMLGMLWALDDAERRGAQRLRSGRTQPIDDDRKADARERLLPSVNQNHQHEEGPWKSDS